MDLVKIGKFIASCRKKQGLTQDQLGEMLGISGKSVSKWERGINFPEASSLPALSNILGITVMELLNGEKMKTENIKSEADTVAVESLKFYNKKANKKNLKIMIITIAILIVGFMSIFIINNYNKCRVYKISNNTDNLIVNGYVILNQKNHLLFLNQILYSDKYIGTDKEILVKNLEVLIKCNDTELYKYGNVEEKVRKNAVPLNQLLEKITITIDEDKSINKYIINEKEVDELYIIINYIDGNNNRESMEIKLNAIETFSNNKLFYF